MLQIAPSARLASSPMQGVDACTTHRVAFAAASRQIGPRDITCSCSAPKIGARDFFVPWIPWLLLLSTPLLHARAQDFTLASPDRSREIRLRLDDDGRLTYRVLLEGRTVLRDSPLGVVLGAEEFRRGLDLVEAGEPTTQREQYELFSGIAPRVDSVCNRRSVKFKNDGGAAMTVDLAASDQGVAFRYRFAEAAADVVEVLDENTGFRLPEDAKGWMQPYHVSGEFTPAYEDFYFVVKPGDPAPHSRAEPSGWSFPALFHVPSAKGWLLITEVSSQDPYPACHLVTADPVGTYTIEFPVRQDRQSSGGIAGPATPTHKPPWTMPWRTIIVGAQAADIATSTLLTDLAPPTTLSDVSWIKPGRASWAWWSHPEGPFTKDAFAEFTDFAAEMGWEYTLFDANWWDAGITTLVGHAKQQGVGAHIWTHARDYATLEQRTAKLEELAGYGAVGLKADFWCSDSQETMATIQTLLEDASRRRLLVTLHGCTLPRGWHRTWPNLMTAEAVLGAESYLYESAYSEHAAALNTILPFTRNVAGPMDYTPFALSPKHHRRTTTDAHELANSIICTSGIIHYADSPSVYRRLPPAVLQILRDAPARWEETRCLVGDPGRCAVFARRSGSSWLVAGISGSSEPVSVALDLTDFLAHAERFVVEEAGRNGRELAVKSVPASARWQHTMPPRGGFVLRMNRPE
jgi:hypothetical protein